MRAMAVRLTLADQGETQWLQYVGQALRDYGRLVPLAHSPLADPALIGPALVLDDVAPTADERARALRLLLLWGVGQLAPAPTGGPEEAPPADDPTWRNPLWWGHHLLRYRYIRPLHPDEYVADGRFTETIIQLTGIAGPDAYYAERNRAIASLTEVLRRQLGRGEAGAEIQRLALAGALRPLADRPETLALLRLAAVFEGVFKTDWLEILARSERIANTIAHIDRLRQGRFLRGPGEEFWLSPAVRGYLLERLEPDVRRRRHNAAAGLLREAGQMLPAAEQWLAAGAATKAAELLLEIAPALMRDLHFAGLREALRRVSPEEVAPALWRKVQILLCDLLYRTGELAEARAACRLALSTAETPADLGRLYRRLGKLYEGHNQTLALDYYRQAAAALPSDHPERIDLLKDRGWLLLLREDWTAAEADLRQAEAAGPAPEQRADILEAVAALHHLRGDPETAVALGRQALAVREQLGDPARIARTWHNLARAYSALGRQRDAIAAYEEARRFFVRVGDHAALATTLLSLGAAVHRDGRLSRAVTLYRDCLLACRLAGLPLVEVKAQGNLAEALAQLDDAEEARLAWQRGYEMALRHAFSDQVAYFDQLREELPPLQAADVPVVSERINDDGDPVTRRALALAREKGHVTARQLMAAASVSKATATRRLSALVEAGQMERRGRRRGVHYVLVSATASDGNGAWRERLARLRPVLADRYRVRSLGVLDQGDSRAAPLRIVADFSSPPSLVAFFQMEAYLRQSLGIEIDILPLDVMPASETGIRWLTETHDRSDNM